MWIHSRATAFSVRLPGGTRVHVLWRLGRVAGIAWLSLCPLFGAAPEEPPKGDAEADFLTLQAALDSALENNLGLVAERYRVPDALDAIEVEAAAFDLELFGSAGLNERQAAARSSALDEEVTPESRSRRAELGGEKRLETGASLTLQTDLRRSWSNNNAARNPDWASGVGLNLRQPLLRDAWASVNLAPLARARIEADQSVFELRSIILDLLANTEIAYWNLAYARAERALVASSIELAKTLLEENRERERLGLVTPLEVLQAEAELVDQQEAILETERQIDEAADALRRRIGNTSFLGDLPAGGPPTAELPAKVGGLRPLKTVVREAVAFDLGALAQEREIEIRRINRLLAEDDMLPSLDFVGDLAYSGRDEDGGEAFRGAYSQDGYNWNLGMELRFPWGFRAEEARLRQAERNLERARIRLADLKQEKALAARSAWRAVDTGLKRIEVTSKLIELNERSFEQERARYGAGATAYRRVLEAQRDLDRARSNHLSAIIETLRARVRLSRTDGTILQRNGYTWEALSAFEDAADPEEHPLLGNQR